jgi:hypothetical protein
VPLVYQPGSDDEPNFGSGVWRGDDGGWQYVKAAEQGGEVVGQPLSPGKPGGPSFIVSGSGPGSQVEFDGSNLSPTDGPTNPLPGPSRTWGEFLYEVYIADSVTVYGNTSSMAPGERAYTVLGFFIANLVGVRGVSDAFSAHDAADAHEQSGAERASDGVFGAIGLVCTALPFTKPVATAGEAGLARLARGVPANATGATAGAGQVTGIGDDIARAGSAAAGGADDAAGVIDDAVGDIVPIQFGRNADQLNHAIRHVKDRVDVDLLQRAIGVDLEAVRDALAPGLNKRSVFVEGVEFRYHAFLFPDGTVNVGRITPLLK